MNELLNQMTNLIANVPTFVWGLGIAFFLLLVGVVITAAICLVKYLRSGIGEIFIEYAKILVIRGFDQLRKVIK